MPKRRHFIVRLSLNESDVLPWTEDEIAEVSTQGFGSHIEARATASEERMDWSAVARAAWHPVAIYALELITAEPGKWSPAMITRKMAEDLAAGRLTKEVYDQHAKIGNVAYHVRMLQDRELVQVSGTKHRRGAIEHFYRPTRKALNS